MCRDLAVWVIVIGRDTEKKMFKHSSFDRFRAYNGWLESWKATNNIPEMCITEEVCSASVSTDKSWIEKILSWLDVKSWKTCGTLMN